ncbi:hypothetical protein CEP52_013887 [Fusarium oligoseptatum]|uniref:Uncharacterized protein n=1 Tax=Fusarium oligoseptatum TaxID=2604345 RepID=A0A428SR81_9HYPO|nr:hypothetical protein CEP52_013887 [Fusarium oligoseptatum]
MNPQHTSTVCSTVVTEAVCVLLSTQPHAAPGRPDANNRPEAASEAHGAEVIAFPNCYIAPESKSGSSSAGNLE